MKKWATRLITVGLPVVALGMLILALVYVTTDDSSSQDKTPPVPPQNRPFKTAVAGAAIVEPRTEPIEVATPVPDVVQTVHVQVNDDVEKEDLLFELETRPLEAELGIKQAALELAEAELARLRDQPRQQRLPVARATVALAEAELKSAEDRFSRTAALGQSDAVSEQTYVTQQLAVAAARAKVQQTQAELDLLQAGAWSHEIQIAQRQTEQARAEVEKTKTAIERRKVRAPVAGKVLRVEIEPGEFVGTPPGEPVVVMGDVGVKHVRVDIDEHDIPRFDPAAKAVAVPRGSRDDRYPLELERVEPFVIPKQSLTGRTTERVDTRVLQVIYAIGGNARRLYIGQQMDVYIQVSEPNDADSPGGAEHRQ